MSYSNKHSISLSLLGFMLLACDVEVEDLNDPGVDNLRDNPTRRDIQELATGLLVGTRAGIDSTTGYVAHMGVLGRESYSLGTNSDPRFITELLLGNPEPLAPTEGAYGGALWSGPYANIWAANVLAEVLPEVDFTDEERHGLLGFSITIKAFDLLKVIVTRDENGAVLESNTSQPSDVGPIICKQDVYATIVELLDEAADHLQEAGAGFVFPLGGGFTGFDTPDTFLQFNRALLARVQAYRENYDEVLSALESSFLTDTDVDLSALDLGVYYLFSGQPGGRTNRLVDPFLTVHPRMVVDAEEGDARLTRKITELETVITGTAGGITLESRYAYRGLYPGVDSPIAIIRNEELLLLRAEANLLKNTPDLEAAAADINLVRTISGGLDELAASEAATIEQLLYERRYSLMYEGGHRWIDMRRFDRLQELQEEDEESFPNIPTAFPIPQPEADAREGDLSLFCSE